jgi:hypothetical protein
MFIPDRTRMYELIAMHLDLLTADLQLIVYDFSPWRELLAAWRHGRCSGRPYSFPSSDQRDVGKISDWPYRCVQRFKRTYWTEGILKFLSRFVVWVVFWQYFAIVFTDSNTSPTADTRLLRTGLANFNPQEGHITRKDSPEGRTCVYKCRKSRGGGDWIHYNFDI